MSVSKELSLVKEEKFVRYWDTICNNNNNIY